MTLKEDERQHLLSLLRGDDKQRVAYVLEGLEGRPSGDVEIRAAVRALLEDRTPVRLWIPFEYGEIRWRAVRALSAERQAVGEPPMAMPEDVPLTLDGNQVSALSTACGMDRLRGGSEVKYGAMRDRGLLPTHGMRLPSGWGVPSGPVEPEEWPETDELSGGLGDELVESDRELSEEIGERDPVDEGRPMWLGTRQSLLSDLADERVAVRSAALRHLAHLPIASEEFVDVIRPMLGDATPVPVWEDGLY
jgi:hypothetical protein